MSATTISAPTVRRAPHQEGADRNLHDTQRRALEEMRARAGIRSVEVREVTIVTDSVQMLVEVDERGCGRYQALIAPSGRVYRLPGSDRPAHVGAWATVEERP